MATYDITIHPADGSPSIELPSFTGSDDLTEAVHEIGLRIRTRRPRPALADRVEVKTDNPKWTNDYQGPVKEWVPEVLHKEYQSSAAST